MPGLSHLAEAAPIAHNPALDEGIRAVVPMKLMTCFARLGLH